MARGRSDGHSAEQIAIALGDREYLATVQQGLRSVPVAMAFWARGLPTAQEAGTPFA